MPSTKSSLSKTISSSAASSQASPTGSSSQPRSSKSSRKPPDSRSGTTSGVTSEKPKSKPSTRVSSTIRTTSKTTPVPDERTNVSSPGTSPELWREKGKERRPTRITIKSTSNHSQKSSAVDPEIDANRSGGEAADRTLDGCFICRLAKHSKPSSQEHHPDEVEKPTSPGEDFDSRSTTKEATQNISVRSDGNKKKRSRSLHYLIQESRRTVARCRDESAGGEQSGGLQHKCPSCGLLLESAQAVYMHMFISHAHALPPDVDDRFSSLVAHKSPYFTCRQCRFVFLYLIAAAAHLIQCHWDLIEIET